MNFHGMAVATILRKLRAGTQLANHRRSPMLATKSVSTPENG
jgi:hypothetical protein